MIVATVLPFSIMSNPNNHDNFWTEKDANAWATMFFGMNSAIGNDMRRPKEFSYLMNDLINH